MCKSVTRRKQMLSCIYLGAQGPAGTSTGTGTGTRDW